MLKAHKTIVSIVFLKTMAIVDP